MHRLRKETRDAVDSYWSAFFGCAPDALHRNDAQVFSHVGLGDYAGAYAMTFDGAAPIVSVTAEYLDRARPALGRWSTDTVNSPADLQAFLGARAGDVIGPAAISYLDPRPRLPATVNGDVRVLSPSDAAHRTAVQQLAAACRPTEWAHGGTPLEQTPAVGVFADASLIALAGYDIWGDRLAHIAVVTHPDFRGRGFGSLAVVRLIAEINEQQLIPQYRTLMANESSLRLAATLGFIQYARSLAVQLRFADT
jgi:GNAT superfamily N-acetyltransferase